MSKTSVQLSTGFYELEAHGPIHVTKNGSYSGCIEFDGGFGPVTYRMVQSAIDNTVTELSKTPEDTAAIGKAIRRVMQPEPTQLTNAQVGLLYSGLACGACVAREHGHDSDAKAFHEVMELLEFLRLSDFNFAITPLSGKHL